MDDADQFYDCVSEVSSPCKRISGSVYNSLEQALAVAKNNKSCRIHQVDSYADAQKYYVYSESLHSPTSQSEAASLPSFPSISGSSLIKLKNIIRKNEIDQFRSLVEANPMWLITSSDTPTILQNMHTPLHIASKNGFINCTRLLLKQKFVDRSIGSKISLKASELACDAVKDSYLNSMNITKEDLIKKMELVFNEYYVGLFEVSKSSSDFMSYSREVSHPFDLVTLNYHIQVSLQSNAQGGLLSTAELAKLEFLYKPEHLIETHSRCLIAYAGPFTQEKANMFMKLWNRPCESAFISAEFIRSCRSDVHRGRLRLGSSLAKLEGAEFHEYWGFARAFVNLESVEGLSLLDDHIQTTVAHLNELFHERQQSVYTDDEVSATRTDLSNRGDEASTPIKCVSANMYKPTHLFREVIDDFDPDEDEDEKGDASVDLNDTSTLRISEVLNSYVNNELSDEPKNLALAPNSRNFPMISVISSLFKVLRISSPKSSPSSPPPPPDSSSSCKENCCRSLLIANAPVAEQKVSLLSSFTPSLLPGGANGVGGSLSLGQSYQRLRRDSEEIWQALHSVDPLLFEDLFHLRKWKKAMDCLMKPVVKVI